MNERQVMAVSCSLVAMVLAGCTSGSPTGAPATGTAVPDTSIPTAPVPEGVRAAIAESQGVQPQDVLVHAAERQGESVAVVALVAGKRMLLDFREVDGEFLPTGSTMLIPQPLVEGARVFAVDALSSSSESVLGGYVDPAMDRWKVIDTHGNVEDSGTTTPAFVTRATDASQLRILTEGCVAYAASIPPSRITDARPLESTSEVERVGAEFVSSVGEDDAAAAALGPYGPDALWFPQQLADVLGSVRFDPASADVEIMESSSSYDLMHPDEGQRLKVSVASVDGVALVLGYQLFGGCR